MVNWERFEGDDAAWDNLLGGLNEPTIFQSSHWAKHKRNFGWEPIRLLSETSAIQFLIKRAGPGAGVAWARGGPAGRTSDWNPVMFDTLRRAANFPLLYARLCSYRANKEGADHALQNAGWNRCSSPLNKDTTMILDLTPEAEKLETGLSSNWRHNLKRGNKRCAAIRIWEKPNPSEMISVYRDMESYKKMAPEYDDATLRSLIDSLGNALTVFRADDESGNPIAFRAVAVEHEVAWDLLAATSQAGRKSYAAYALLWKQIIECRNRGAKTLDLGGVDPQGGKGVYDFKRGTGASLLQFLGEWDWASPSPLRPLAAVAIKYRGISG